MTASLSVLARAPSNIALVKYMGKKEGGLNIPENSSISMTLDSLCTVARATFEDGPCEVRWKVDGEAFKPAILSVEGRMRIERHAERVLAAAPALLVRHGLRARRLDGLMTLQAANTFPASSGIASSASSFAAVTLAVTKLCVEGDSAVFERVLTTTPALRRDLAALSRQGSGSSCRSFEGPFVRWEGECAMAVPSKMPELAHFVVLISREPKKVSSSEAHRRVKSSPQWEGRAARAETRCKELAKALACGDLHSVARIAWADSWDMHGLFHTSEPAFSYWEQGSIDGLHWLAAFLNDPIPPVVTMDAGPNIHVIVDAREVGAWRARFLERYGEGGFLEDRPGLGAS